MDLKHIKLFEHFRSAFREAGIPVEPEFEEVVTNNTKRYLFVELANDDMSLENPTIEIYDTEKEAKQSFLDMKNGQSDIKVSKWSHDGSERDLDFTFLLGYNEWYEHTGADDGDDLESAFNGDAMRIVVDELKPEKSYVLVLLTNVLGYELHEYNSVEEAENSFVDMIENTEWEDKVDIEEVKTKEYFYGDDYSYFTHIKLIK